MSKQEAIQAEAKFLVNIIYQPLGFLGCSVNNSSLWEWAKGRAADTLSYNIDKLPPRSRTRGLQTKVLEQIRQL